MTAQENQGRLWIRLVKKNKIVKSLMVPCTREDPQAALAEALPALDLSQPMWLSRNEADWAEYAMTRFKPEHFVDSVPFDSMEISYIYAEDEGKTARRRHVLEDV
ncbi:MAG: hypothetical protein IJ041_06110 [Clostridia bacterium]|nr:hypothetical protein [Clostridia bacterium]